MSTSYLTMESNVKKMFKKIQNTFKEKVREESSYGDRVAEAIVDKMVDDLLIESVSEAHRAFKMGYSDHISLGLLNGSVEDEAESIFFPESLGAKSQIIICPKCERKMGGTRFAGHLNRCRGSTKDCSNMGDDEWRSTPEKNKNVKKFDGKRKKEPVQNTKPYKPGRPKNTRDTANSVIQKEPPPPSNKSAKDSASNNKNYKENVDANEVWVSPTKQSSQLREEKVVLVASKSSTKPDQTGKARGRSLRANRAADSERVEARKHSADSLSEGLIEGEDGDNPKNMVGNFSTLNITPLTPSKKKERKSNPREN